MDLYQVLLVGSALEATRRATYYRCVSLSPFFESELAVVLTRRLFSHKITGPLVEGEDMVAIVPPDSACANGVFKFSLPGYELLRDLVALR